MFYDYLESNIASMNIDWSYLFVGLSFFVRFVQRLFFDLFWQTEESLERCSVEAVYRLQIRLQQSWHYFALKGHSSNTRQTKGGGGDDKVSPELFLLFKLWFIGFKR